MDDRALVRIEVFSFVRVGKAGAPSTGAFFFGSKLPPRSHCGGTGGVNPAQVAATIEGALGSVSSASLQRGFLLAGASY
jgi:hypothetical protein